MRLDKNLYDPAVWSTIRSYIPYTEANLDITRICNYLDEPNQLVNVVFEGSDDVESGYVVDFQLYIEDDNDVDDIMAELRELLYPFGNRYFLDSGGFCYPEELVSFPVHYTE